MEIIRGTTPTFIFTFSEVAVSNISVAYFHITQLGSVVIEKDIESATVEDEQISFTLTQAESFLLDASRKAKVSLDWKLADGTRGRSKIYEANVLEATKGEVI